MRKTTLVILFFLVLLISACSPLQDNNSILQGKKLDNIDKVMIAINFNDNPTGKNEAKVIVDKKEIESIINAFTNTIQKGEIEQLYGNQSIFVFYSNEKLVSEIRFYPDKKVLVTSNGKCYECEFKGDDPWTLYGSSKATTIFIDSKFTIIY